MHPGCTACCTAESHALETHSDHIRAMRLRVKIRIYSCIAAVRFVSLQHTLWLADLQVWKPFASSIHRVIWAFDLPRSDGTCAPARNTWRPVKHGFLRRRGGADLVLKSLDYL